MKKAISVLLITAIFASVSALALVLYDDTSPAQKECKTCVFKAVGSN